MTYLVDANVLSEAAKPNPSAAVIAWLRTHEPEFAVDAVVLGEIRFGIHLLPAGKRRRRLEKWIDEGVAKVHRLASDWATGQRWAKLLAEFRAAGQSMPIKDSMIAASALVRGLIMVTRNRKDFEKAGVIVYDPFE